jgi:hypothetical protein
MKMNATKFNFTDRKTYLTFVSQWKEEYKDLSDKIRKTKIEFKEAQRRDVYSEYSNIHFNLRQIQRTATQMSEDRREAKALSAKMRNEAKEIHHA